MIRKEDSLRRQYNVIKLIELFELTLKLTKEASAAEDANLVSFVLRWVQNKAFLAETVCYLVVSATVPS